MRPILGLLLTLLAARQAGSQYSAALKRLAVVQVSIDFQGDTSNLHTVSSSSLRTSVELRLRQAGLAVVSDRPDSVLLKPYLFGELDIVFQFKALQSRAGTIFTTMFRYDSALEQTVRTLQEQPRGKFLEAPMFFDTWHGLAGIGDSRDELDDLVRQVVSNMTDTFLNAYLASHPSKSG